MISEQERKDLVTHKMARAGETIQEADALFGIEKYSGAVNRGYYAAFYAAGAVLLSLGFETAKHAQLISLFHREVINKGLIDKEFGRILSAAFEARSEGDYKTYASFTREEVETILADVKKFVARMREYLGTPA